MKRILSACALLLSIAVLGGCAHPINLNGDSGKLIGSGTVKSPAKVGLLISDEQRKREVTTSGGGGDKLSYLPYRDLETGLYVALSESFASVTKLGGAADPKIQADGLRYVVSPTINTTSFSPSLVTWPPTVFTVELLCNITDAQSMPVLQLRVQGEGRAEFDDFKTDHSMAAKRAAEDALKKLIKALSQATDKLR